MNIPSFIAAITFNKDFDSFNSIEKINFPYSDANTVKNISNVFHNSQNRANANIHFALKYNSGSVKRQTISIYKSDSLVFLFWGELYQNNDTPPAKLLAHEYSVNGIEGISQIDGQYGIIVIDTNIGEVQALTDHIGKLFLSYTIQESTIYFSSHETLLVRSLGLPIRLDQISVLSTLQFGWSIGGKSLLQDVERISPYSITKWNGHTITQIKKELPLGLDRITTKDRKTINSKIEEIVSIIENNTFATLSEFNQKQIFLTAGIDSRVCLALAHAAKQGSLKTITDGAAGVQDVEVAKKLSNHLGYEHIINPTIAVSNFEFNKHLDLIAFTMNGDTSASRALSPLPNAEDSSTLKIYGVGGEIFTGYYYGNLSELELKKKGSERALHLLQKKYLRKVHELLDFNKNNELLQLRLEASVHHFTTFSDTLGDILDLYYLGERYSKWGGMSSRFSWKNQFSPFDSPLAVFSSLQLPSPVSQNALLHKTIINKHIPSLYNTPINGTNLLIFVGNKPIHIYGKKAASIILKRFNRKYSSKGSKGNSRDKIFQQIVQNLKVEDMLENEEIKYMIPKSLLKGHEFPNYMMRLFTIDRFVSLCINRR